MRYGDWLKMKRGRRGAVGFISQQRLADQVGIDRTYLNRIERGFIQLPEDDLRGRIHRALGTSDDDVRQAGVSLVGPVASESRLWGPPADEREVMERIFPELAPLTEAELADVRRYARFLRERRGEYEAGSG